jgi:putative methionine-R-sulfoxide reductase with GAF domain
MSAYTGAVEAIDRILNRGGEADDVLRAVVDVLHDRFGHFAWVGIYLVEGDELVLGPAAGQAFRPVQRRANEEREWLVPAGGSGEALEELGVPIRFQGRLVGALDVRAAPSASLSGDDQELLRLVAVRVSAVALVAWDTGGVPWDEVS